MGLLQKAVETYDNMASLAGVAREDHPTLQPISHIVQRAQIEVALDRDGRIVSAHEVPKEDCKTIIPATEKSGGRAGKVIAPHPLSDQLDYLLPAGGEKHRAYLEGLVRWDTSPFTHEKVRAVRRCIESGALGGALEAAGLVKLKPDGSFSEGKTAGAEYAKCLVRWRVQNTGDHDAAWEDRSLMSAYTDYYQAVNEDGVRGLCMISGEEDLITSNHPKGITAASYGAKLISANDSSGFTYRGRFFEPWQAATVGYRASQKAHSALQWVAADQGVVQGGRTFLCWNPKGVRVQQAVSPVRIGDGAAPLDPTQYRRELRRTLTGLRNELPDYEDVIVCAFDAATTGRLSLTYYNELRASDFYGRVEDWYASCCWENGPFGVQSPPLFRVVERAFGTERSRGIIEVDDRVKKEQLQRLMTCITDRAPVPYDIVAALCHRASTPLAYSRNNRAALLHTACAITRKYLNDKSGREEWTMAFEPGKNDRSYQYGCLLAVMEKVERDTYDSDEGREPNAIRLQSVFCERPLHTAFLLNGKLEPYFARLRPNVRAFYKRRIGEIMAKLSEFPENEQNKPLKESYLMGYYLQRADLYTSHKMAAEQAETEEN